MDPRRLKLETEADHRLAEQSLPLMARTLDRDTYIVSLQKLYGFMKGWELWADTVQDRTISDLLAERRRSSLLVADLNHFAASVPGSFYAGPSLDRSCRSTILGAVYVVEGSTLGGQYIAKHVEQALCLTPEEGDSYFRGYKGQTGSMWAEVQALLQEVPDGDSEAVISSAKTMFRDFTAWMIAGHAS